MDPRVQNFLSAKAFGVVGASTDRAKFGNKVLRCYQQHGYRAIPIHPREKVIESLPAVAEVKDLPPEVEALSIVTPPKVTEQVVSAAIASGIRHVWMQPGSESADAVARAKAAGLNVIADGTCLLATLGFDEG
jgi:predicted CoA-binding protein